MRFALDTLRGRALLAKSAHNGHCLRNNVHERVLGRGRWLGSGAAVLEVDHDALRRGRHRDGFGFGGHQRGGGQAGTERDGAGLKGTIAHGLFERIEWKNAGESLHFAGDLLKRRIAFFLFVGNFLAEHGALPFTLSFSKSERCSRGPNRTRRTTRSCKLRHAPAARAMRDWAVLKARCPRRGPAESIRKCRRWP